MIQSKRRLSRPRVAVVAVLVVVVGHVAAGHIAVHASLVCQGASIQARGSASRVQSGADRGRYENGAVLQDKTGRFRLKPIGSLGIEGGPILGVDFSADGRTWCSTGKYGELLVWDGVSLRLRRRWPIPAYDVRVHPRGTHALVSRPAHTRSRAKRQPESETAGTSDEIFDLTRGTSTEVSSNGRLFAWSGDGSRLFWIEQHSERPTKPPLASLHVARVDIGEKRVRVRRLREILLPRRRYGRLVVDRAGQEAWLSDARAGRSRTAQHVHVDLRVPDARLNIRPRVVLDADLHGRPIYATRKKVEAAGRLYATGFNFPYWAVSRDRKHVALAKAEQVWVASDGGDMTEAKCGRSSGSCRLRFAPCGSLTALDLSGQLLVQRDGRIKALSGHPGRANRVVWSADGGYIAASSGAGMLIADRRGRVIDRFMGSSLLARDDSGGRFVRITQKHVHVYDARRRAVTKRWDLPRSYEADLSLGLLGTEYADSSQHPAFAIAEKSAERLVIAQGYPSSAQRTEGPHIVTARGFADPQLVRPAAVSCLMAAIRVVRHPTRSEYAAIHGIASCFHGPGIGSRLLGALQVFDDQHRSLLNEHFESSARAVCFSPDGKLLAFCHADRLSLYTTSDYTKKTSISVKDGVEWIGFIDSEHMLTVSSKQLQVWKIRPSVLATCLERMARLQLTGPWKPRDALDAIDLAPDGSALALAFGTRVYLYAIEL